VHPAAADNAFTSATAEAHSPAIASVRGGLGRLPGALATSGRFEVRLKSTVRLVERSAARWRVAGESFDGVVVATPAPATGRIVASVAPRAAYFLAGVDYASVAVATFVLGDATLPEATGLAVRQAEGTVTTDAIFSTRKWPWLAEAAGELQVVRAAVGRPGETALLQHSDAEVLALAQTDVQSMIGTDEFGVVAASSLQRWGGALPQYDAGHGDLVSEIEIEIAGVPGLELCGAAYRGSGIAEVVAGAQDAADRLERTLGH
jgi:oxygen-dependent protoporphyrinogen oxidase